MWLIAAGKSSKTTVTGSWKYSSSEPVDKAVNKANSVRR